MRRHHDHYKAGRPVLFALVPLDVHRSGAFGEAIRTQRTILLNLIRLCRQGVAARAVRFFSVDPRQPISEDGCSKRGSKGYDAGQKIRGRKRPYLDQHRWPAPHRPGPFGWHLGSRRRQDVPLPMAAMLVGSSAGPKTRPTSSSRSPNATPSPRASRYRAAAGGRAHLRLDHQELPVRWRPRAARRRRRNTHHDRRNRYSRQAVALRRSLLNQARS